MRPIIGTESDDAALGLRVLVADQMADQQQRVAEDDQRVWVDFHFVSP